MILSVLRPQRHRGRDTRRGRWPIIPQPVTCTLYSRKRLEARLTGNKTQMPLNEEIPAQQTVLWLPTVLPFPKASKFLLETMNALSWPTCNCAFQCSMHHCNNTSAIPSWMETYGTVKHGTDHFVIPKAKVIANGFIEGMQVFVDDWKMITRSKKPTLSKIVQTLLLHDEWPRDPHQDEEFLSNNLVNIGSFSGFTRYTEGHLYASSLYELRTFWTRLALWPNKNEERHTRLEEQLIIWIIKFQWLVVRARSMHGWLESQKPLIGTGRICGVANGIYMLRYLFFKASIFWLLQWSMHLLESIRIILGGDAQGEAAERMFNSGGLPWQCGWDHSNPRARVIVDYILRDRAF